MLKRFEILTDTHAIDGVTFDFKDTSVCCFVSGYTDYLDNSKVQIISK